MSAGVPTYRIWEGHGAARGPIELTGLVGEVKSGTVQASTWIFKDVDDCWVRAGSMVELQMFFRETDPETTRSGPASETDRSILRTGVLRRVRVLADMEERQLESFLEYMEVVKVRVLDYVVRRGDQGDSMYMLLEGEVRAVTRTQGHETVLSTLAPGDSFGEISLLDHQPRSADIIANDDCVLLKISASSVDRLTAEAPDVAAPFLKALAKSVAARLRKLTKKYEDSLELFRSANELV